MNGVAGNLYDVVGDMLSVDYQYSLINNSGVQKKFVIESVWVDSNGEISKQIEEVTVQPENSPYTQQLGTARGVRAPLPGFTGFSVIIFVDNENVGGQSTIWDLRPSGGGGGA